MVTIQNMEVRFDVEGEGDEQVFARLFKHHVERWARQQHERARREKKRTERTRAGRQGWGRTDADSYHQRAARPAACFFFRSCNRRSATLKP